MTCSIPPELVPLGSKLHPDDPIDEPAGPKEDLITSMRMDELAARMPMWSWLTGTPVEEERREKPDEQAGESPPTIAEIRTVCQCRRCRIVLIATETMDLPRCPQCGARAWITG